MIQFNLQYIQRPYFAVPSIHHQTLLSKTVFEHCLDYVEVAVIALASKSIQNSSLAPNFASKTYIHDDSMKLFDSVFHPSSALPIQFVPELSVVMLEQSTITNPAVEIFVRALIQTKYFRKSIRKLELAHSISHKVFFNDANFVRNHFHKDDNSDDQVAFSNLESLRLSGAKNLTEAQLAFINSPAIFPRLQTVVVHDVLDIETFEKISRINKLSSFDDWNDFSSDEAILTFTKNSALNLTRLCLGCCENTTEETFRLIGSTLANLTELEIWAVPSAGFNIQSFDHLASLHRLKKLSLCQNDFVTDANLALIVRSCSKIMEFRLMDCGSITDVGISHVGEHLHATLRSFHVCRTVCGSEGIRSLGKCRKLEEIDLGGCSAMTNETLKWLLVGSDDDNEDDDNENDFEINNDNDDVSQIQILRVSFASIDHEGLRLLSKFAPHLEQLTLALCPSINFSDSSLRFPNVTNLDLSGCRQLTEEGLANVVAACPGIKSANLTSVKAVSDATLSLIAASWWRLEELTLNGCDAFTEDGLANTVMSKCVRLKILSLNYCASITDKFVRDCLPQLRRLQLLHAVGCENVTSSSTEIMAEECPRVNFISIF